MATVAAILGKELPSEAAPDSYNALPELLGKPSLNPNRLVIFAGGNGSLSLRYGKWKYFDGQTIFGQNPFAVEKESLDADLPPGQLYNIEEDIRETNNLYNDQTEIVEMMKQKLEEIIGTERESIHQVVEKN